jgi:hypothetical protein
VRGHCGNFNGAKLGLVVDYRANPSLFDSFVPIWDSSDLTSDGFEFFGRESFERGLGVDGMTHEVLHRNCGVVPVG